MVALLRTFGVANEELIIIEVFFILHSTFFIFLLLTLHAEKRDPLKFYRKNSETQKLKNSKTQT